jgi:hypothetical protein
MADAFSWGDMLRWLVSLGRVLPDRILRWAWSKEKFLGRVELFHFSQSPYFFVRKERGNQEIQGAGFNLLNFTPFKFVIVGLDVRISVDSQDLVRYERRFASEIQVPAYGRSGFMFPRELSDSQAARMRSYPNPYVRIRIWGDAILRTPLGEQRKPVEAEVVATIDR